MEKEVLVDTGSPTKKIIIVAGVMLIFMVIFEVTRNYFESAFIIPNKYVPYFLGGIVLISLIILAVFLTKRKSQIHDGDVKKVLIITDNLLDKLPVGELKKFSKTKDAELYKDVLKKYGVR